METLAAWWLDYGVFVNVGIAAFNSIILLISILIWREIASSEESDTRIDIEIVLPPDEDGTKSRRVSE